MGNGHVDLIEMAESFMGQGRFGEAENLLRRVVSEMPDGWGPVVEGPGEVSIAFWDMQEFLSCVAHSKECGDGRKVEWTRPSYPRALYMLAYMALEQRELEWAMSWIGMALGLEPDHPTLLSERGCILSQMGRHQEALQSYLRAIEARPWAPACQRARAMRGAGVALIDLGELDGAEDLLLLSLDLEPDSEVAINELGYIEHLRSGGGRANHRLFHPGSEADEGEMDLAI